MQVFRIQGMHIDGVVACVPEIKVDNDRAKYWLGVGAQPTDTVRILLKKTGAIEDK